MNPNAFKPIVISQKGGGLCNSLFNIVNGIIKNRDSIILIDEIYTDYSKENKCCISDFLDLEETNKGLKEMFGKVCLIDRFKCDLKILSCSYGCEDRRVDVTKYFTDGSLVILKSWNLNTLFTDPCVGKVKELRINYSIDDNLFTDTFSERLEEDIIWNTKIIEKDIWKFSKYNFLWYNAYDENLFRNVVTKLKFHKKFYAVCSKICLDVLKGKNKINVIHLRIEEDAIIHWSKQNRCLDKEFEKILQEKYLNLVRTNIPKGESILILSYIKESHPFLAELRKDHDIILIDKEKYLNTADRELSAVIDLILSTYCSGIFIGNHNFKLKRGSTFSYVISCLRPQQPKIFIDLDDIHLNPVHIL